MGRGPEELSLRLNRVGAEPGDAPGSFRVLLETTRGNIEGLLHPVEGGTGAIICVGGAMGGLDGPADKLYGRLPEGLGPAGVTVLRLNYRQPNNMDECVLDVLAGCSFLRGIGATDVVLAGHSFGGAVVIKAGEIADMVRGVVSLSPQLFGTRTVEQLQRPLLLVHGTGDTILASEASEDIYRRAKEPKQLYLYEEAGHGLAQCAQAVYELMVEWIPARLAREPLESCRVEVPARTVAD
jgi:pimeloyl-ACP methyl ester carboxylesterase